MPLLIFLFIGLSCGFPRDKPAQQREEPISARQLLYVPTGQQHFVPNIPFDFSILEPAPQFQISGYGFGGGPNNGQPFLLQPGSPPPGNFLGPQPGSPPPGNFLSHQPGSPPPGNFIVPQPGPNVILRDSPNQRPVLVASYPKPAHIPPIEKDAEEVPTNPAKRPPATARKPEKLETFNEPEAPKRAPTEAEVLAAADKNPLFNRQNLRPGQRFFILNGQPLFSNYPLQDYPETEPNTIKFSHNFQSEQDKPIQNVLLRNAAQTENSAEKGGNLVLLNQPENFPQDTIFRNVLPFNLAPKDQFFQYQALNADPENDAIIIDARESDQLNNEQVESEVVSAPDRDTAEPTISQAQPGAIALAGPGGIADASPRGNAFVGAGGVAVSSPQATAVAGPSKDGESGQKGRKQANKNKKQ